MNLSIDGKIQERLDFLMRLGQREWGKQLKPLIKYDLKGKCGGQAIWPNIIRVNLPLLFNNEEDYLEQTIGHEYAHLLNDKLWGLGQTKDHGTEWKSVMVSFDLEPKRCHNYVTDLPKASLTLSLNP
jgi:SprT protein|tara:strand:+ start:385 stop:765 length:381 start_codon:yes stop_codon:yes gene_type:complete